MPYDIALSKLPADGCGLTGDVGGDDLRRDPAYGMKPQTSDDALHPDGNYYPDMDDVLAAGIPSPAPDVSSARFCLGMGQAGHFNDIGCQVFRLPRPVQGGSGGIVRPLLPTSSTIIGNRAFRTQEGDRFQNPVSHPMTRRLSPGSGIWGRCGGDGGIKPLGNGRRFFETHGIHLLPPAGREGECGIRTACAASAGDEALRNPVGIPPARRRSGPAG